MKEATEVSKVPDLHAAARALAKAGPLSLRNDGSGHVWLIYGDGDGCAQIAGNLGLEVTAREIGEALVDAVALLRVSATDDKETQT